MKIFGIERNKRGEPIDHYWKWMDFIEQNTITYAAQRRVGVKPITPEQQELHIPNDPELYAVFFWD